MCSSMSRALHNLEALHREPFRREQGITNIVKHDWHAPGPSTVRAVQRPLWHFASEDASGGAAVMATLELRPPPRSQITVIECGRRRIAQCRTNWRSPADLALSDARAGTSRRRRQTLHASCSAMTLARHCQ